MLKISSVSPHMAAPGQAVHVHGFGFHAEIKAALIVGGSDGDRSVPVTVHVYGEHEFTFAMPAGVTEEFFVEIDSDGEKVRATAPTLVGAPSAVPAIRRLEPATAKVGERVYAFGSGFVFGETLVTFPGGARIGATVHGPDHVSFEIPEGARGGTVEFKTPNGAATVSLAIS